jgi:hypothetical protein
MASSVTPLAAALIGAGGAVFGAALTTSGQLPTPSPTICWTRKPDGS